MRILTAIETYRHLNDIRWFEGVRIEIDFPVSRVIFKENGFDLASQIVSLQFLGGYNDNDAESRLIFLNNNKVENDDLFLWEDESILKNFIIKNNSKLKEDNNFLIEIKNKNQLNYIKQTIVDYKI